LAGFADGEGNFYIDISKSPTKVGVRVQLVFKITQHIRDAELLKKLMSYLGCGRYKQVSGYNHGEWVVQRFSDIDEKIIPFFEKFPLVGAKLKDYEDFKKAAVLVKSKAHLTSVGLEDIKNIKAGMNSLRK